MALTELAKCFIVALFIRDDGERLILGDGAYQFNAKQLMFATDMLQNDTVDIQGGNGVLLAGQVRRASNQQFAGYIGDASMAKTDTESARRDFLRFFVTNHFYKVVYIMPDGTAVQRKRGFLTSAPEVKEIWQQFPEYSVTLSFEDVNYYQYDEDEQGAEIPASSEEIPLRRYLATSEPTATITNGSLGEIAVQIKVTVTSSQSGFIFRNYTSGDILQVNGAFVAGDVITVDSEAQTVEVNGTATTPVITGHFPRLVPGENELIAGYVNYGSGTALVQWSGIEW